MKELTLIIPVYEYIDKLSELINSIPLDQIEVILIDDGSAKNKQIICNLLKEYEKKGIKTIESEHVGTYEIRKKALQYVKTSYFTFVDSDDLIFSKNLLKLKDKMKEEKTLYGIGGLRYSIDGVFCGISRPRKKQNLNFVDNKRDLHDLLNTVWGKIYHVSLIPFFSINQDLIIWDDTILPYYIAAISKKASYTNASIYYYRMRRDSSFFVYTNNTKSLGLNNLYKSHQYRKEAFKKINKLDKYHYELDAITIRLFLQRVKSISKDKKVENKQELANIILCMLSNLIDDWNYNPYYKEKFKSCELNDVFNTLIAIRFMKKNGLEDNPLLYQNKKGLTTLCEEYDKKLVKK